MAIAGKNDLGRPAGGWRLGMYEVIFESETRAGRLFDKIIIAAIVVSVLVVIADSVKSVHDRYLTHLTAAEWFFTILFTAEYIARLISVDRPRRYALSFFGIVDFLAILPTYLALLVPEAHALIDLRILRLLRIFRVFKLTEYVAEYQMMGEALKASRRKIMVFLCAVLMVALVLGTMLYVVEGPEHGFKDIPTAVYWAITTITTVGFGDITPKTGAGRFIASVMMLIGWGTLAVPTGIVTAEMSWRRRDGAAASAERTGAPVPLLELPATETSPAPGCLRCGAIGHAPVARYCHQCAERLPGVEPPRPST